MGTKTKSKDPPTDLSCLGLGITEHAPLPMAAVEGTAHIVRHANLAFCRLLDRPMKQLIGKPFRELLPEEDECVTLLDRVLRTGKAENHTEEQPTQSHPVLWSYTMWPMMVDECAAGVMILVTETAQFHEKTLAMNEALMLGAVRQHELTEAAEKLNEQLQAEIIERKRVDTALRASEALFSSLIERAPFGMYVVDAQFRLRQVNSRAMPVFATVAPLIGRDFSEVIQILWGSEIGGQIVNIFRHTLKTGERYISPPFSERRQDLDVEQSYEWELQRVTLPDGQYAVVCYFADVSEHHALETSLAARASDLAQADRSKDEFLAMLAHELRNPLAPMRNAAEILSISDASAEEHVRAQRILARQIENMTRMIDDLLDVSRITEGKIELRQQVVRLETVFATAANLARPGIEARGQHLAIALPAEPVFLIADATRLEQAFGNLLNNACKYSGPGSHISLHAERAIDHGTERPEVIVRVRDDGIGIAPELLPRIFDLFVQATRAPDRMQGGLGIGLTLVQRLVQLHGGSVQARSEGPDRGSEFVVRLPILPGSAAAPPAPPAPPSRETPRRMLIVDDNEDSARSMATLQRLRGHETRTAFAGPDAIATAAEFVPEVVLLDIGLPGMDGYEVARRLRAMPALTGTFLVAMSGYGSPEDLARARAAGFDEYLVKPADLDLLRTWLQNRAGELRSDSKTESDSSAKKIPAFPAAILRR